MNIKQSLHVVTISALAVCLLAGCGSKQNSNKKTDLENKELNLKEEAIDKKVKEVDGKEVTEYTLSNGAVVQVDGDQDIESSNDEGN
ncbi:hypothetical protein AB1I63_01735 [Streptococcus pneumoniae]